MAERRMFAKTIVLSDPFLDMPLSTRCLYFTLGMLADDEGFINSPKSIMRQCGATQDDLQILIAKKFIITFESGVIVIKHWKIHNYIRGDRIHETKYQEEKSLLTEDENNSYSLCQTIDGQLVDSWHTEDRLGKDRLVEDKEYNVGQPSPYEEIISYLNEKIGTHYQSTSGKTQTLIRARMKESFTVEDFKTVIDNKVRDWKGTEMEQYLRPETLFGTKFEGYLNSKPIPKTQPKPKANSFTNINSNQDSYLKSFSDSGIKFVN